MVSHGLLPRSISRTTSNSNPMIALSEGISFETSSNSKSAIVFTETSTIDSSKNLNGTDRTKLVSLVLDT